MRPPGPSYPMKGGFRLQRMQKMRKKQGMLWILILCAALLTGCAAKGAPGQTARPQGESRAKDSLPALPEKLRQTKDGAPKIRVYQTDEDEVRTLDVEEYLLGVVAGEMKNDWPLEALKAQAILARTFVVKFCAEKESKYPGADISTDVEEAQAYDATGVNERVEQAVESTRGLVLVHGDAFPYAWFHAHSGGMTALAKEGLNWEKQEPGYTQVVQGMESPDAPAEAQAWQASFSKDQVLTAAKKAGLTGVDALNSIAVGERGPSGRAETILINGQPVSAAELRLALGGTRMRSTLLTGLKTEGDQVAMAGKGYGHGVGMPQWGAYALAQEGKTAEEIVLYYFRDVTVEKLW